MLQLERQYARVAACLKRMYRLRSPAWDPERAIWRAQEAEYKEILKSITVCVRLFEPNWDPARVAPRPTLNRNNPFKRGELMGLAFDVLRHASSPVTTSDIIDQLLTSAKLSEAQARDSILAARLTKLLRNQERMGTIRSAGESPLFWRLTRSPASRER